MVFLGFSRKYAAFIRILISPHGCQQNPLSTNTTFIYYVGRKLGYTNSVMELWFGLNHELETHKINKTYAISNKYRCNCN